MFDVVVIGGGPAGVSAALRARELGATVALVERREFGGTCTNDGCVPTRVLAHAARLLRDAAQFSGYGLIGDPPSIDFVATLERVRDVVAAVRDKKRLERHLERAGASVFRGEARFVDPGAVALDGGERLEAARFVIAGGGHPRHLSFPGSELSMNYSDIWSLRSLPRSVVFVGAAATGCQLASIFAAFGAQVRLLEVAPRILAEEDELVSTTLADALEERGIEITVGMAGVERIERVEAGGDGDGGGRSLRLHFRVGDEVRAVESDAVILAVGWPGNVEELGLEAAGVRTERGYVAVDDALRTSAPHIFAAGDITGRMKLVQSATYEARIAAENAVTDADLLGRHGVVPHGGFTDPEYASVGLTEARATAEGEVAVAVVPYCDLDRAVIDGRTEGVCKLIVERQSRRIVGAHVVGEQATEVVQLVATAMAAGARVEELAQLELAYPTFTAIVGLCARQLVRELGVVPLAPAWRALLQPRAAEWERSGE